MHSTENRSKKHGSIIYRVLAITVMMALMIGTLSLTVFAQNSYIITDGDDVTVHKSYSDDPDVVLDEVGIELSEEDTYTTTYNDGVSRIDIQRMQMVTVLYRGESRIVGTYGETVEELLSRMDITVDKDYALSCKPKDLTYDGMIVAIVQRSIELVTYQEIIPCPVNTYEDATLEPGEEIVLIEGSDGTVEYTVQITYENGVEKDRIVMEETVLTEPVTRLVVRGPQRQIDEQPDLSDIQVAFPVDPEDGEEQTSIVTETISDGVITTANGTTYEYYDTLTVTCTAYSCEGYEGITAIGSLARVGAVAVDPRYIPLGTKMYIVSNDGQYVYGYCVAEDTGGLIKGYKIDLYFDTVDECWEFGVRTCTVYVLR